MSKDVLEPNPSSLVTAELETRSTISAKQDIAMKFSLNHNELQELKHSLHINNNNDWNIIANIIEEENINYDNVLEN